MLVSCREMLELEEAAFAAGSTAEGLMEQAGAGMALALERRFPHAGTVVLYLGRGNNAGDALVAGRELMARGWRVGARFSREPGGMKPLPQGHWKTLEALGAEVFSAKAAGKAAGPLLLLDGLLGIGASGPLRGVMAELAAEMNELRVARQAVVAAMDVPSGLNADTGDPGAGAVRADVTLTVGAVKAGLVADAAVNHTGALELVEIPALAPNRGEAGAALLGPGLLAPLLGRRDFDTHKGMAGRVSVVAGGPGMLGAAELACTGALRAGAGMVTLWCGSRVLDALRVRMPAEVMVRELRAVEEVLEFPADAMVAGPGLGAELDAPLLRLLGEARAPVVADADALNALARTGLDAALFLAGARGPRLITPHPGEWRRIGGDGAGGGRRHQAEAFAQRAGGGVTVLLKGSRTVIATAERQTWFNGTGHPGMATGGMGDVLSGVLGALLATGKGPHEAGGLGAWLCGRAAEIAAADLGHEWTVLPSDAAARMGRALAMIG